MDQSLRIAYAGTPEFAVPALKSILSSHHDLIAVITQPDRRSGRGRKISESAVKQSINSGKLELLQPENINDDEVLNHLAQMELDLIIVAAYGQIFTQRLLDLPKLGCINIHASLLPRWRGASPIQHAILSGDEYSGVTIMQMAKKMDAGDIWLQADCAINLTDTAESLHAKLAALGGEIILPAIKKVTNSGQSATLQDDDSVTYCSKLSKADGLIDWCQSAEVITRKMRALHPWPGSYTFLEGRRIRITQAQTIEAEVSTKSPGSIIEISKQGILVTAGNQTYVQINELVPEGGKKVTSTDFTNSNDVKYKKFGVSP